MQHSLFDDVNPTPAKKRPSSYSGQYRAEQLGRLSPAPEGYAPPELPHLNGEKRMILNAEATGVKWWPDGDKAIGWAFFLPESGRKGYLPIRHAGGNLPVERVNQWLSDIKGCHIENTNDKFDIHIGLRDGVDLRDGNTFGDAAHYAALLDDNRRRFGLDQLAVDMLNWDMGELGKIPEEIKSEGEFQHLHPTRVAPYALRNVEQVAALIDLFTPQIKTENLERVLDLEQRVIPAVVEMEENGTHLDLELLERFSQKSLAEYEDSMWLIKKQTGVDMGSPDSPKDLEVLFTKLNLPMEQRTAGGRPSFTANVLAQHKHIPAIAECIRAGQLADLQSKYLSKYRHAVTKDGWLRFNLHQLRYSKGDDDKAGAVSGRFSASGDSHGGFNPQQVVAVEKQLERNWLPDYVLRRLFVAKEGEFFAADMAQVEYRIFAHYANDPSILMAYAADPRADFHAVVMKLLHRINTNLNRKLVKNINFAKIYGAGLIKFAFMLGVISEAVYQELAARLSSHDWSALEDDRLLPAKELDDAYNLMFPQVKPLLKLAAHLAQSPDDYGHQCNWKCEKFLEQGYEHRGWVADMIGRRARLTGRYHSALNRIIQGGAASINKMALVAVYEARKALDFTMRLTVHDELCGDLRNPEKLGAITSLLNEQRFPLKVPILWDVKTGSNWAACK